MKTILAFAALATFTIACQNDKATPPPEGNPPATTGAAPMTATSITAAAVTTPTPTPKAAEVAVNGIGACTVDPDSTATASRLLGMADEDGDGQISKEEATTVSNFLVGGFFFRADANTDGTVTPEEGKVERGRLAKDHPAVTSFFLRASKSIGGHPFQAVADVLNIDSKKPLTMAEARSAATSGVDDFFRVADADHDGRVSPAEMKKLANEGVRAAGHMMFQAADTDHSGGVSLAELQGALQSSEKAAFEAADGDKNGQLTEAEAAAAMNDLVARVSGLDPRFAK